MGDEPLNEAQLRFTLGNPSPLVDKTLSEDEIIQLCKTSTAVVEMHRVNTLYVFEQFGARRSGKKWRELNANDLNKIYREMLPKTMEVERKVLNRERYAKLQRHRRIRRINKFCGDRHEKRYEKKVRLLAKIPDKQVDNFIKDHNIEETLYSDDSDNYIVEDSESSDDESTLFESPPSELSQSIFSAPNGLDWSEEQREEIKCKLEPVFTQSLENNNVTDEIKSDTSMYCSQQSALGTYTQFEENECIVASTEVILPDIV